MKRVALILSLVVGAWMLSPAPEAQAWSSGWNKNHKAAKHHHRRHKRHKGPKGSRGGSAVPELDPSAAGSAMVLLVGGIAYLASRRREEELA